MAVPGKKATKQFSSSITSIGSDEDLKVYCQPCDRDGPRLPAYGYCTNCAEHLCESCFTVHSRHTLSRHHTLLDKVNMPQLMSAVTPSQSDNLTKPCPKHNIEMIKYYCHDHEALLCSVCVTLEHTKTSCKVDYLPDISDQVIGSKKYQDILQAINDITKDANVTLQDMKKVNFASNKSLVHTLTDIDKFRTKINQRLDEMENHIKEVVKDFHDINSRNRAKLEKECRDLSKPLKASSDAIIHLNTSKQANELFMELKQAEQLIKDYEKRVDKLTEFDIKGYSFEPNEAISNLLSKETSMGTLKSFYLKLKSRKISIKDKICVKTSKDICDCWITGMTLLTPSLLIITDANNMAVKMVDISKMTVLDQLKLDDEPYDASSISQDKFAVTIQNKHIIQFMSVSGSKLKKKQTIKVEGRCYGISCHKDKMVVTFEYPCKVQILRINGTVLQTIQDERAGKSRCFVTTSDKFIYLSDFHFDTVTKLNWQGEVKDNHHVSQAPRGLAVMPYDGNVFVCFHFGHRIGEIPDDFNIEQTVTELLYPEAVCWSAETCTLYISSYGDDKNIDNSITMCKFLKQAQTIF